MDRLGCSNITDTYETGVKQCSRNFSLYILDKGKFGNVLVILTIDLLVYLFAYIKYIRYGTSSTHLYVNLPGARPFMA